MSKKELNNEQVIAQWTECDLTARAASGDLPRAYEMDDTVTHVHALLSCGARPFIVGEPGVGKTAIVYEVVRRAQEIGSLHPLHGRRVIQLSLSRRAASLQNPDRQIRPEMERLVEALVAEGGRIVPFVRDAHLADMFDLELHLESLALRLASPCICEGLRSTVDAMFENRPALAQNFVLVTVEEPAPERVAGMLQKWSADQALGRGVTIEAAALEAGLELSHRFLARSRMPRKAMDLLVQTAGAAGPAAQVTQEQVIERFCVVSSIPRLLVDPRVPLDLQEVRDRFAGRILGQPEAVDAVVDTVALIKSGLLSMHRPFSAFLFVGPTGVGKTHVAQLLAEFLFGRRDALVRLNLADHPRENSAGVLFGDSEQYRLPLLRGTLTQRLAGRNFGVMLLDEFEKAHPRVHDRFLQLIDEGCFINGAGELISCRSMIIIATSNAGAEVYRGEVMGFTGSGARRMREQELSRRLQHHFRVELLNRFDRVVRFRPLDLADMRRIAQVELLGLAQRGGLKARRISLDFDDAVVDWLMERGYDPDLGARYLCHAIQRHASTAIAQALLTHSPSPGSRLHLVVHGDTLHARVAMAGVAKPASVQQLS